jgi:methionine-rich copper-binding protein CopC
MRFLIRFGASLVIAVFAFFALGVQTASAHTHLKSSTPADGSTLQTAPKEIKLTFEDIVNLTAVSISGADGKSKALSGLPAEPVKEARLALPALSPGDYTVNWRAAGHDGHVMSGHLKFTVAAPAAK